MRLIPVRINDRKTAKVENFRLVIMTCQVTSILKLLSLVSSVFWEVIEIFPFFQQQTIAKTIEKMFWHFCFELFKQNSSNTNKSPGR